jgi:uncharacterized membrane protein
MNVKEITFNAMFIAIVAVMALIPNLGIITVGPISITILHIPVIVAGIAFGMKSAIIVSLAFGLSTMFVAMTRAVTPIDVLFVNPVLSVFPRLLFGLTISFIWKIIASFKVNENISISITAFFATVFHAIFVLGTLYFFLGYTGDLLTQINEWFIFVFTIIISNTLLEAVAAILLSVPLVHILWRIYPNAKTHQINR